jgi:low temperature requirement protein LtrA
MLVPDVLLTAVEPWSTVYGESTALAVGLTFAHLGAMMVGGGLAIAADRALLRTPTNLPTDQRLAVTMALADVHRPVVLALIVSAVSGGLQLAADLEALAVHRVMWVKFGLLLLLAGNGLLMLRNEAAVRKDPGAERAFRALRVRAVASIVLWLAITLAGVGLMQG